MERNVDDEETCPGRRIQTGDQIEKYRSFYASS